MRGCVGALSKQASAVEHPSVARPGGDQLPSPLKKQTARLVRMLAVLALAASALLVSVRWFEAIKFSRRRIPKHLP